MITIIGEDFTRIVAYTGIYGGSTNAYCNVTRRMNITSVSSDSSESPVGVESTPYLLLQI